MAQEHDSATGPDLTQGARLADFADGKLIGHVGDEQVLLVQGAAEIFAVAAHCTHYHGPLAEGLVVGDSIRCPWHHACFNLRSGEAVCPPAISPLARWRVEQQGERVVVRDKVAEGEARAPAGKRTPGRIVIVGGGAAGFAAAEMLRRHGYAGSIIMFSGESAAPVDRPNLSKDYLAGTAPEEWVPLRPDSFYAEANIELHLDAEVSGIDARARQVVTRGGERTPYDRMLLATGAEPIRLKTPGADQPHIHTLRSLADSRAIIAAAKGARRALVVGASFIGLEVAAALRAREVEVHVVAPERCPMERILGPEMGAFVRALHEQHGVIFHLEDTVAAFDDKRAILKGGSSLETDFVVVGVGVQPRVRLAEQAGLALDRGVAVDAFLQTSAADIYAAGDIARWPDRHSRENIRVEHWVVAQRQGQVAAMNMLGERHEFDAVPFFWSQHYDVPINYIGHAERWDELVVEGDIASKDCLCKYKQQGKLLAVASIFRDLENLRAELEMERQI